MPKFSVVIPLFNKYPYVSRAIISVLSQTFIDFELIIVNDGSTDSSAELVRNITDPRLRLVEQENAGVSAARNRGISESCANLVAFLDADDEWRPDFLASVVRLQEKWPQAGVFSTRYLIGEPSGIERPADIRGLPPFPWEGILDDYFYVAARSEPPIFSSSVVVRKSILETIGGFPSGVRSGEDLLTWARLALITPIAYTSQPLSVFWKPSDVVDRPSRFVDNKDVVGEQLVILLRDVPPLLYGSFVSYLRRWHEMRAAIQLQLAQRKACLKEIRSAVKYGGYTPKLVFFVFLAYLPGFHPGKIYHWSRKIKRLMRGKAES